MKLNEMMIDSKATGRYINTQRFVTLSMTPGNRTLRDEMVNAAKHVFAGANFKVSPWEQPDLEIVYRERDQDTFKITLELSCFPFTGEFRMYSHVDTPPKVEAPQPTSPSRYLSMCGDSMELWESKNPWEREVIFTVHRIPEQNNLARSWQTCINTMLLWVDEHRPDLVAAFDNEEIPLCLTPIEARSLAQSREYRDCIYMSQDALNPYTASPIAKKYGLLCRLYGIPLRVLDFTEAAQSIEKATQPQTFAELLWDRKYVFILTKRIHRVADKVQDEMSHIAFGKDEDDPQPFVVETPK